jgi:AraC-like DNA-binding protein
MKFVDGARRHPSGQIEGRQIGRKPLELDRAAIFRGRQQGLSLGQLAKAHRASRATIHRVLREQTGDCSMNEGNSYILPYMLMAVTLGFMMGWGFGEQTGRKDSAEDLIDELRDRLQSSTDLTRQLKQLQAVINDLHRKVSAVSKGLGKHPS